MSIAKIDLFKSLFLASVMIIGIVSAIHAEVNITSYTHANRISSLALEGDSIIWAGTKEGGVVRWNTIDGTYRKITTSDGLIANLITSIAIDSSGNKWFGTRYNRGISMYDGSTWTNYVNSADGLPYYWVGIYAIAVDGEGNKWFGTDFGLFKFDGSNWTTYDTTNGLSNKSVNAIAIDDQGTMWLGTGGGVDVYDGSTWTNHLPDRNVSSIAIDSSGYIWIGTHLDGVSVYNGNNWGTYTKDDGLPDIRVLSVAVDKDGYKWFGNSNQGVTRYTSSWTTYNSTNSGGSLPLNYGVNTIAIDNEGNKWFGTDVGLIKFDGSNWTTYTTEDILEPGQVNAIETDSSGVIWFGSDLGLTTLNSEDWANFSHLDWMNRVHDIAFESTGQIWLSLLYGVYTYENGSHWRRVLDGRSYAIAVDLQDKVWVGLYDGVNAYDGDEWEFNLGPFDTRVQAITIDDENRKWFGTYGNGITVYDDSTWTSYTTENYFGDYIDAIAIDGMANKWFGTSGMGLYKFDGSEWTMGYPLSHNYVNDIEIDNAGNIWVGTEKGANRFNGSYWTVYNTGDGLADNNVQAISIDSSGNYWFGTYGGVSMLEAADPIFQSALGNTTINDTTYAYTIWVKLHDVTPSSPINILLSEDGGVTYSDTLGCVSEFDNYVANIPARPYGTTLHYFFETLDSEGNRACIPEGAPANSYIIEVLEFVPGDVGGDGTVNIFDLLELLKIIGGSADENQRSDVNADGKTDIFDLLELLKKL